MIDLKLSRVGFLFVGLLIPVFGFGQTTLDPDRILLYEAWKNLPQPPITPYSGPFGPDGRAFVGNLKAYQKTHPEIAKGYWDWKRNMGTYDPSKDPRPINLAFEKAAIEDWRRMGYNCAYKGNTWTYRSGRYLKSIGMLGAIDQTLWGVKGPPPLNFDGSQGKRYSESCGSFFHPDNFQDGVKLLTHYVRQSGDLDMFKVGNTYVTSSWDEVGLRTRQTLDYRPEAIDEYRTFLEKVWFQDTAPGTDSNQDGRTYNAFTGEQLSRWDQVQPPLLSPKFNQKPRSMDSVKWTQPGKYKLWIDFHRYYTFEFFRRVSTAASQKLSTPGRVICYPFSQHFICWPGINYAGGNSFYWYHRLSDVVNVEHCWPDHVAMPVNYGITNRLARKYKNVVMGWTWFYFGKEGADMYNGPHDCARGLARMMGHRVDGIHHWLYSPIYRGRDRRQRKQIAYWHQFLGEHYRGFLSKSEPIPAKVAVLMPDWTGYFYRMYQYPQHDWGYTFEGLQNAQLPFEIVTEEELELEQGVLDPYQVLYVVGSEWTTPTLRRRIQAFLKQGGVVLATVDSLSLDIPTGKRTDFLATTFGAQITHRYKNSFYPSTQTEEEATWGASMNYWKSPFTLQGHHVHRPEGFAPLWKRSGSKLVRNEAVWKQLDTAMSRMPRQARGISQSPLDMRSPPKIRYADHLESKEPLTTWGEVNTARVVRGKPIAWYQNRVCGIETDQTVWLGTRPGGDIHAMAHRMSMHRGTYPCNPYLPDPPDAYAPRSPYRNVLAYAAKKAGVVRPVTLSHKGQIPCNLEILSRADAQGTTMVFVINHDATDATYQVQIDAKRLQGLRRPEAWDVLNAKSLEHNTDGRFALKVPAWGVCVFMIGNPDRLKPIKQVQARIHAKDLSVPQYFRDRPHLNQSEWDTPIPPIEE